MMTPDDMDEFDDEFDGALNLGGEGDDLLMPAPVATAASAPKSSSVDIPPWEWAKSAGLGQQPAAPKRQRNGFAPEIESIIDRAADAHKFDPVALRAIVGIESGGDPMKVTGKYKGMLQLDDDEFRRYAGDRDIYDPEANVFAGAAKLKDEARQFQNRFGREPTSRELYLVHQQGMGGFEAHRSAPERPAWESMYSTREGREKGPDWAKRAIWGNLPDSEKKRFGSVENVTSGDFSSFWEQRFDREMQRRGMAGPVQVAQAAPTTMTDAVPPWEVAKRLGIGKTEQQPAAEKDKPKAPEGFFESTYNGLISGYHSLVRNLHTLNADAAQRELERLDKLGSKSGGIWDTIKDLYPADEQEKMRREAKDAREYARSGMAYRKAEEEKYPISPSATAMMQSKTWTEVGENFLKSPVTIIANIGAQSLPQMLPALFAATITRNPYVLAPVMGWSSGSSEYAGEINDAFQEAGVDINDPKAVAAAFDDAEKMAKIRDAAFKKGAVVGLFDAISMGVATKTLLPAKTFATSPVRREAANLAVQMPVQGVLGAAGEGLGSLAAGKELSPGAMAAEFFGEFASAPIEVASLRPKSAPPAKTPPPAATPDAPAPTEPAAQQPSLPTAPPSVPSATPPPVPVSASDAETSMLKKMGWTDEDIADMDPVQRRQELEDAAVQGITPDAGVAAPVDGPDLAGLIQQARDLVSQETPRAAMYIPPETVSEISGNPEFVQQIASALQGQGTLVDDVDGKGGMLLAKDEATGAAVKQQAAGGADVSSIVARLNGETPAAAPAAGRTPPPPLPTAGDGTRKAPVRVAEQADVQRAEQVVATPTDAQKEAGNYQKGHMKVQGLDIAIENPKGSERSGTAPDGSTWSTTMPATYGYFKRSKGKDGDQIDVYVGPNPETGKAFVVDQIDPDTGKFDEHKVMLGYDSASAAQADYEAAFSDDSGADRMGGITEMPVEDLKKWVSSGRKTKPVSNLGKKPDIEAAQPVEAATEEADAEPDRLEGDPLSAEQIEEIVDTWAALTEIDRQINAGKKLPDEKLDEAILLNADFVGATGREHDSFASESALREYLGRPAEGARAENEGDSQGAQSQEAEADQGEAAVAARPGRAGGAQAEVVQREQADGRREGDGGGQRDAADEVAPRKRYDVLREEIEETEAAIGAASTLLDEIENTDFDAEMSLAEATALEGRLAPVWDATIRSDFLDTVIKLADESIEIVNRDAPADVRVRVVPIYRDIARRARAARKQIDDLSKRMDALLERFEVPDETDIVGPDETQSPTVEPSSGYQGEPLSDAEIDTLVSQWQYVREVASRKKPQSLAAYVIANGGLQDGSREVRHIAGSAKERPGLVNKNGRKLDDMALSAWQAGFLGHLSERPTIAEFLDALQDDLHTGQVVQLNDEPVLDDLRVADEIERELADYGITKNRFRSEESLRRYLGQSRPGVAAETARDEAQEPAADEGQAGPDQAPEAAVDLAAVENWWRRELTPAGRRLAVQDAGLKASVAKVAWQHLTSAQQAALSAEFQKQQRVEPADEDAAPAPAPAAKKPGQTSLVPEATTKEKIAAAEKEKANKGKAKADSDAGELFNPDAGKQTDLVEMAKAPVAEAPKAETPVDKIRDRMLGEGFADIRQARQFAKDAGVEGTNKAIEEALEAGIVAAARQIVAEGADPAATYAKMVALYNRQPNLGSRTGTSSANQAYSTPMPLAYLASRLAGVAAAESVYEPTAGNGALIMEATPSPDVHVNELDPSRAAALRAQGFEVTEKDGSDTPSFDNVASVIMNPPFGAVKAGGKSTVFTVKNVHSGDPWTTTSIDHAVAINGLNAMADDGRAVLIVGGVKATDVTERRKGYRGQAKREFYYNLYSGYNVVDHFTVSGDLYAKQGAGFPVDVIVIEGRGKSERALPAANPPVIFDSWDSLAEKLNATGNDRADGRPAGGTDQRVEQPDGGNEDGGAAAAGTRSGGSVSDSEAKPARVRKGRDRGQSGDAIEPAAVVAPNNKSAVDRDAGRVDQPDTPRAPRVKTERKAPPAGSGQSNYVPASTAEGLDTLIPVNMADAAKQALARIVEKEGDLNTFVAKNLGYEVDADGPYFIRDGKKERPFSAEQIDAIASAIENTRRGAGMIIGDQCVAGHTRIYDPVAKTHTQIKDLASRGRPISVLALTAQGLQVATATSPFCKGVADLYRVVMDDGRTITVTRQHRFLTPDGWRTLDDGLSDGHYLASAEGHPTNSLGCDPSIRPANAVHSIGTDANWTDHCSAYSRPCGEQPHAAQEAAQAFAPSPSDVLARIQSAWLSDDQDASRAHSRLHRDSDRRARNNSSRPSTLCLSWSSGRVGASHGSTSLSKPEGEAPFRGETARLQQEGGGVERYLFEVDEGGLSLLDGASARHSAAESGARLAVADRVSRQSVHTSDPSHNRIAVGIEVADQLSSADYTGWRRIMSITFAGREEFFDMWVPGFENYVAEGVINHNTGIGKGRVAAGMLRYAMMNDMVPLFVTEKPDLYGDMYRDLNDIGVKEMLGRDINMFLTNAGESIGLDEAAMDWKTDADAWDAARDDIAMTLFGETYYNLDAGQKDAVKAKITTKRPPKTGLFLTGKTPDKTLADMDRMQRGEKIADIVFTTYDQMSTLGVDKKTNMPRPNPRRQFLSSIINDAFMVLDESHNAGGTTKSGWGKKGGVPDRSEYVRELAARAKGVMFSSATYAKRPDVMDLYSRTDMGRAVDDPKNLPNLIKRGGVPMQQIVASMLSKAGQYLRRERSFEGVEYAVEPVPVNQKNYEAFSDTIRAIFEFDLAVQEARKEIMQEVLDAKGMNLSRDSGVGQSAAHTTSFSSIMHNIVNQMLLSIKSGQAAQRAIQAAKAGEKPVIALANTNESFIRDFAEQEGVAIGQAMQMDFSEVLRRYLKRTLRVTIKHPNKKVEHVDIPVERLGAGLQKMYRDAMEMVDEADLSDMPISPIDAIRNQVQKAGLSVAEITGRQTMIDYSANTPKYVLRPKSEIGSAGKRASIAAFNRGSLDVLILNRSGSTGVSMHASSKFRDQRRRRMILAQAEGNIDTHLQMLGRVHRTGQVIPPAYSQIAAEIPAEMRPLAVLMRKMASLNANTTGARGSMFMSDAVDFMNEVGDKIVADILMENPDIDAALGGAIKVDNDGNPVLEDAAKRATGRLVLLKPAKQAEFLDMVQKKYKAEIEQLDALGENPLEAKTLDLQAKTIETTVLKPKQGDSPFLDEVRIEKASVKAQGRAMLPSDILTRITDALSLPKWEGDVMQGLVQAQARGRTAVDAKIREVMTRAREWIRTDIADMSPEAKITTTKRHEEQAARWQATASIVRPGAFVRLSMPAGDIDGIVMQVERTGSAKLPVALGSWEVRIAVPDGAREYVFPMSKLFPPGYVKSEDEKGAAISASDLSARDMVTAFEDARKEGRETRYIVTGNILGGFDQVAGKGRIVNYSTDSGEMQQGVLMGREFDIQKFMGRRAVRFGTPAQAMKFLEQAPLAEINDTDGIVKVRPQRGGYFMIEMPAARGIAGKYFTDRAVIRALGGKDFERRSGKMMAIGLTRAEALAAMEQFRVIGATFETRQSQEIADAIVAADAPPSNVEPKPKPQPLNAGTASPAVDRFAASVQNLKSKLGVETRPLPGKDDTKLRSIGSTEVGSLLDRVKAMTSGSRVGVVAEEASQFVRDVEAIIGVAEEQAALPTDDMSLADIEKYLSALYDLKQIIDQRIQTGYELAEDVQAIRDLVSDRLDALSDQFETLADDADTVRGELSWQHSMLQDRIDELDEEAGIVRSEEDEGTGTEVAIDRANIPRMTAMETKEEYQQAASALDVLERENTYLASLSTTMADDAKALLALDPDTLTREQALEAQERISHLAGIHTLLIDNLGVMMTAAKDASSTAYDMIDKIGDEQVTPAVDRLENVQSDIDTAVEAAVDAREVELGEAIEIDGQLYGISAVMERIRYLEHEYLPVSGRKNFEEILSRNPRPDFVTPQWIADREQSVSRLEAELAQWKQALAEYESQNGAVRSVTTGKKPISRMDFIIGRLLLRQPVDLSADAKKVFEIMDMDPAPLPSSIPEVVVTRLLPKIGSRGRYILTAEDRYGVIYSFEDDSKLITKTQGMSLVLNGRPAVALLPFDFGGDFVQSIWAARAHEAVHALRVNGFFPGSGSDRTTAWGRLVGHADLLSVLAMTRRELYARMNDARQETASDSVTTLEVYTELYANNRNRRELLEQEAVAHMIEVYKAGGWTEQEIAPVKDLLDAIMSGEIAQQERTELALDMLRSVGDPNFFESISDMETGQSMRRDLDELGFYSKALEAAKGLKQAKGTPEQMRAQLKAAGVTDAELVATRVDALLPADSTPDEKFWAEVKPMDAELGKRHHPWGRAIDNWVGGPHDTIELGITSGLMIPSTLENLDVASQDDMAKPVRDALRARYGDTITVYRGEEEGGTQSTGRRNKLNSYTTSKKVAGSFTGARNKPIKVYSEEEIAAAEKALSETGEAKLGRITFRPSETDGSTYVDMFNRGGDFITDVTSIRDWAEGENAEAKAENDRRAQKLRNVKAYTVPVDAVIWATDRFNQREIIARADAVVPAKTSVTRDEIVKHLEENRVGLREVNYGTYRNPIADEVKKYAINNGYSVFGADEVVGSVVQLATENNRTSLEKHPAFKSDEGKELARKLFDAALTKWSEYSLDPSNPTYRETVLHLPESEQRATRQDLEKRAVAKYGQRWIEKLTPAEMDELESATKAAARKDFRSGHFPEPNIIGHMMTSMVHMPLRQSRDELHDIGLRMAKAVLPEPKIVAHPDYPGKFTVGVGGGRRAPAYGSEHLARVFYYEDGVKDLGSGAMASAVRKGAVTEAEANAYGWTRGWSGAIDQRPAVYLIDQIQFDWYDEYIGSVRNAVAQKMHGTKWAGLADDQKAAVSAEIGAMRQRGESLPGVRDEAKAAELRKRKAELDANISALNEQAYKLIEKHDGEAGARNRYAQPARELGASYGMRQSIPEGAPIFDAFKKKFQELELVEAELRTAESSIPRPHPLAATLDQALNTTARRAITQAVEVMRDVKPDKDGVIGYIAIPTGNTVLSYNPGDEDGMAGFYGDFLDPKEVGIVPKNLRNLLQKIDKSTPPPMRVEKLETPSGMKGEGFTLFPITDKVRASVREGGQPMFSAVPSKDVTPKQKATVLGDVTEAIRIVERVAGLSVDIDFRDTIPLGGANMAQQAATRAAGFAPTTAGGGYVKPRLDGRAVILLAVNDPQFDLKTVAGHEAFHHVEEVLASESERRLLTSPAEMERMKRLAATEIGVKADSPRFNQLQDKEIRALAFQRYRRMQEEGIGDASRLHIGIRRVFNRLIGLFQSVRNALAGRGFDSYESLFERARTGRMALDYAARQVDARAATAPAGSRARNVIDPQMEPTGRVDGEPFDLANVKVAARFMASVPLDTIRTIQNSVSIRAVKAKLGMPISDDGRPVSVFKYGDRYYVNDGNHRIEALRARGARAIRVEVIELKDGGNAPVLADRGQTDAAPQPMGSEAAAAAIPADFQASLIPAAAKVYAQRWYDRLQPKLDRVRIGLQDRMLPVRRVEEEIERTLGIKLPNGMSTYVAESLYHGRAGERLNDLQAKHIEPLTALLRANNIDFDVLGNYLYARHAKERNAAMLKLDPNNPAGSGMTDKEADGIIGALEQGPRGAAFKRAAGMVRAMLQEALNTRFAAGLLTRQQYTDWTTQYQDYVPLRGFEANPDVDEPPHVGRGMDTRGPESKRALGRRSRADNPAAYAMQQAVEAIIRSEKNRVDKTLYRAIRAFPDPDRWRVFKGVMKRRVNPTTGLVESYWVPANGFMQRRVNPTTGLVESYWVPVNFAAFGKEGENVFGVKINGKQHYMWVEPGLARALKSAPPGVLGTVPGRALYRMSRFYARLVTSFNPEFVVSNYMRDLQTAMMNVGDVAGVPAAIRRRIAKEAASLKTIRGVMAALQSHEGRTVFGTKRAADETMIGTKRTAEAQRFSKWFDEYRLAGGKISFIDMDDIDRIKTRIEGAVREGNTRRMLRGAFQLIDNANSAVENGVRLSLYVAMRENGQSIEAAATAARELTVNFNRKGEWGPTVNAFYLFFNASVQGTTRLIQAAVRSQTVRRGIAGIFLAGMALDLLNYAIAGADDDGENAYDKIEDWKKEKNLIIMLPGRKDYVQIPMPYGYNVFHIAGQKTAALGRTGLFGAGKEKPDKAVGALLGAMIESFSPFGAAPTIMQLAAPTLLDPVAQIAENRNWFGGRIQPEKLPGEQRHKPDSENYFSTAPTWAIDLAKTLNKIGGGDATKSGKILGMETSVSPETIEHLADFLGGGVAKFLLNSWNTGERAVRGQEWAPEKTPFVRRVYGKATAESRRRDFYEKWNEVEQAHYRMSAYRKAKDEAGMASLREESKAELAAFEGMRFASRQLSALKKQSDVIQLNRSLDRVEKEKQLKAIQERENQLILRALSNYRRITNQQKGIK